LFFVLYPLGIGSETWLVYRAIPHAAAVNPLLGYLLWAVLAIYVPGKQLFLPSLLPTDAGRLVRSLHAHDGAAPAGHAGQGEGARVNGDGVRGVAATRGLWTVWQHAVYQGLHAIQWCSLPLLGSYKYINNSKKQSLPKLAIWLAALLFHHVPVAAEKRTIPRLCHGIPWPLGVIHRITGTCLSTGSVAALSKETPVFRVSYGHSSQEYDIVTQVRREMQHELHLHPLQERKKETSIPA
jgi:hypothetical protein